MLGGVLFAHQEMQTVISVIEELAAEAGKPRWDWQIEEENAELKAALNDLVGADLDTAYQVHDKQARVVSINALRDRANEALVSAMAILQKTSKTHSRNLRKILFAVASSVASHVSMVVTLRKFAPLMLRSVFLTKFMVHRCLRVVRPKPLLLRP